MAAMLGDGKVDPEGAAGKVDPGDSRNVDPGGAVSVAGILRSRLFGISLT